MNVKAGDIARYVDGPYAIAENIGRVFLVLRHAYASDGFTYWTVKPLGCARNDSGQITNAAAEAPDHLLRPIRPDELDEETTREIIEEITA